MSNIKHPKEELMAGFRRLKQSHLTAMLTVADMGAVYLISVSKGNDS